jgi:hypothetical protein
VKNKHGMVRSKEFMKSHAEADTSHEKKESASEKSIEKKAEGGEHGLHHLRVYPADKDGVVEVTHHLGEQEPAHETHAFEDHEGEKLVNHILEHTGMPYGSEGGGEHYADESKTVTA